MVPWAALEALIEPHYPTGGRRGRPPMALPTMLRIHCLQQWYALSDPAMQDALYQIESMGRFAGIELNEDAIPDETTILTFRRLLERHDLAPTLLQALNAHLTDQGLPLRQGTLVDATIIAAPSSAKNRDQARDPALRQTKKGNRWHFGMKAHTGVDCDSGLVHTVTATAANAADVTEVGKLLHGDEQAIYADAGYTGAHKRPEVSDINASWRIAAKRSTVAQLAEGDYKEAVKHYEHLKARLRARVEHPFRVIKRQFGYRIVRYRGLAKNAAQVMTLFALSNLWMKRKTLLAITG